MKLSNTPRNVLRNYMELLGPWVLLQWFHALPPKKSALISALSSTRMLMLGILHSDEKLPTPAREANTPRNQTHLSFYEKRHQKASGTLFGTVLFLWLLRCYIPGHFILLLDGSGWKRLHVELLFYSVLINLFTRETRRMVMASTASHDLGSLLTIE